MTDTLRHLLPLLCAYVIVILFLVIERRLRHGESAKTLKAQPADRGSTMFIGIGFGGSMLILMLAAFLGTHAPGAYTSWWSWGGPVIMVLGLLVRVWSARTLGEFYTRTLVVGAQQPLVEAGPYRWLRHPGYSGDILLWLGAGIAAGNVLVLVAIALLLLPAYTYRIHVEEMMLRQTFGTAFVAYAKKRWRIVPLLY